jgi:hypothetical protein
MNMTTLAVPGNKKRNPILACLSISGVKDNPFLSASPTSDAQPRRVGSRGAVGCSAWLSGLLLAACRVRLLAAALAEFCFTRRAAILRIRWYGIGRSSGNLRLPLGPAYRDSAFWSPASPDTGGYTPI